MSAMLMIPLGVGEAFTARYYTSCYALGVDDEWLLIDCPHPVRKMLREGTNNTGLPEPLDLDRIHAVAVSHLHADHCCGLEDFGFYSFFASADEPNSLCTPTHERGFGTGSSLPGWNSCRRNLTHRRPAES